MRRHLVTTATVLLAVGLLAGWALAEEGEQDGPRRHDGRPMQRFAKAKGRVQMARLIRELELDEEQADKARQIFREHHERMKERREDMRKEMRQLHEEMREALDHQDKAAAEAKMDKIQKLWQEQHREGLKHLLKELSDVLNDEQMQRAKLILKPRKPRRLGQILAALRTMRLSEEQQAKIGKIMDKATDRIVEVLTPEQREKLEKRLKKASRKERRRKFMEQARRRRHGRRGDRDNDNDDDDDDNNRGGRGRWKDHPRRDEKYDED